MFSSDFWIIAHPVKYLLLCIEFTRLSGVFNDINYAHMSKFSSYYVDETSKIYPEKFRLLKNPPKNVYVKGDPENGLLQRAIVGIVGSRKIFQYSYEILRHIFKEILPENISTVSGFMFGVDTEAHKLSLLRKIPTIAVLPCGIDSIHPPSNFALYDKIPENGGLLISEYPGTLPPQKWTFVQRNRLIAALSDVLIVVQAGKKSGSLITADYAANLGKPVLAATASYFQKGYEGNLHLLSTFAKALVSRLQINELLGITQVKNSAAQDSSFHLLPDERILYEFISRGPATTDILSAHLKLSVNSVSVMLTNLQIKGAIFESNGVYHAC